MSQSHWVKRVMAMTFTRQLFCLWDTAAHTIASPHHASNQNILHHHLLGFGSADSWKFSASKRRPGLLQRRGSTAATQWSEKRWRLQNKQRQSSTITPAGEEQMLIGLLSDRARRVLNQSWKTKCSCYNKRWFCTMLMFWCPFSVLPFALHLIASHRKMKC